MKHHLVQNNIRCSKRQLNMNELFLSPSLHHIQHRKQPRLFKQEALNQDRSLSPIHAHRELQRKSIYSSSYTSLNSYLKEFKLSEKDFFELREALKTIFHYIKPKIISDHQQLTKQRLISPYLQQRLNTNDQSSLPLYTNEYFIRNGLLNHNDGPEIYDNIFQSRNMCYSNHLQPCSPSSFSSMMLTSSVNSSLPLAFLSNQKYLLTALTSNFTSEKSRRSQSSMELSKFQYHRKYAENENETESTMIRRNKVQTWERENILQQRIATAYSSRQQNDQIEGSEYQRSSIVRTPSTSKDDKTMKITEESITENSSSLRTSNKEEGNDQLLKIKNTNDLFPMVKILAPYIIIRDSFHQNPNQNLSNCRLSTNIVSQNNAKSVNHVTAAPVKQSLANVVHPALILDKRRSLLLSSLPTMNQIRQINKNEQIQQRKKNYLLAEFESVLSQISQK